MAGNSVESGDESALSRESAEGGVLASEAKSDADVLAQARARFKLAAEAERENRRLGDEDAAFRAGEQWPEEIKTQRQARGRPCLTVNKMPQFEQQVTNDQRQNRPAIKVHPVDDKADLETAKIFQGVIKHIEVASSSDTARDTAFENAVRRSYGFYRIVTEYCDPLSFEQEIRVKRVRDPDSVYLDPNHKEPDGSDAEWGFVFEWIPKDVFRREFGESKLAKVRDADWDIERKQAPDWIESDSVLVAEYFYKEYQTKHIALLSDGQVMEMEDAKQFVASTAVQAQDEAGMPMGEPTPQVQIVKERKTREPSVKWCKLTGVDVLDKTDWPGQWIPILPVYGAEIVVKGKVIRESLIRHAKDPARMYNFWKSSETEAITLAPKAPYVGAAQQFEGYEHLWASANRENHAYLPYHPHAANGAVLPPPQRQSAGADVAAITQASMLAADEVKATLGIYDASLGARSNETSGKAILARNNQAQTSNFHFTDNLTRTIRHEARMLVDLIPKVYDTPRIQRIIGEDGEQKLVPINQEYQNDAGETVMHDMGAGKYDVTVDTGPSYATRRLEAASAMIEVAKYVPSIPQVAGDLMIKAMDWPGAQEIAERVKKTLPPGVADDGKEKKAPIPPEVQQQMQQAMQMVDQLTAKVHELQDEKEQKLVELESRERIEMAKLETTATIELAKLQSKEALNMLAHQIAEIDARTKMLGMNQPFETGEDDSHEESGQATDGAPMGAGFGAAPANAPTGGESQPGQSMPPEGMPQ